MIGFRLLASLLVFSVAAGFGAPIGWNVSAVADLTTPRGAVLTTRILGSFTYDADTATASNWSLLVVESIILLRGPTPCIPPWPRMSGKSLKFEI